MNETRIINICHVLGRNLHYRCMVVTCQVRNKATSPSIKNSKERSEHKVAEIQKGPQQKELTFLIIQDFHKNLIIPS